MADDIGRWLEGLGLGKYASMFAENEITFDALPHLTQDDLKELGLPMGPRKVVAAAIAGLAAPASPADTASAGISSGPRGEAQRRQLTVMFCDLVGSTALSGQLDPEEMRDVILSYQNAVTGAVTGFEGHIAKYMGDGVLAYFGFPAAHEDDAERAARAGLSIVQGMRGMRTPRGEPLMVRVGIATGLVVVGDLIGEGAAQEEAVVGETPNLAARLQGVAEPGQVVVAESTRWLLGDLFELHDLGQQGLKGIAEPVTAFAILAERAVESRFDARQRGKLGAIVGRDQELSLLEERWRQAKSGEGQMVLLSGEAGIGKSRITRGLIDAVSDDEHITIRYQCSPYHTDSALYPTIQQLTRAAGFTQDDTVDTKLDKLESLLGKAVSDPADDAPIIASLLGLEGEPRYGALALTPHQLRMRMLQVLSDQLIGLASKLPVLFVVEDAHWVDPTTLEFLDQCLDRIAGARILTLVTARPVFQHRFGGHPIVTRLALNRLGREQTVAIVAKFTGGKKLPPELLAEIAAKTDGIPLFVEELTKTVLESGALRETDEAYVLDQPLATLAIPTSLHDSLMARLDRMQPVKEVAQTAACIGREFDYGLMLAVLPPADALDQALERLTAAELIFRRGVPPDARYMFKHALVRDAAYGSLLKSMRQTLHARILAALEEAEALPEILALHAAEAGLTERAIELYRLAGEQALTRPAFAEAIAHFRRAIALIKNANEGRERQERELALQVQLGQALLGGVGYGAAETSTAFRRAREMVDALGETPLRFPVYYGNWVGHYVRAELPDALQLAHEMVETAGRHDDDGAILVAHRVLGTSEMMMGKFGVARGNLERGFERYDPDKHRALASRFGQEPGVTLHSYAALTLWGLGYPEQARGHAASALAIARELQHPLTLAYALGHGAILAHVIGDHGLSGALTDENMENSVEGGIRLWEALSLGVKASSLNAAGDYAGALASLDQGLPMLEETGTVLYRPLILSFRLEALVALGRYDEAATVLREIDRRVETTAERWNESDIRRIDGDLRLAHGATDGAEQAYRQALEIARQQHAKSFELRAAAALARLWADRGERQQAHDLLAPILGWFTEGFDLRDLTEATALLDALS